MGVFVAPALPWGCGSQNQTSSFSRLLSSAGEVGGALGDEVAGATLPVSHTVLKEEATLADMPAVYMQTEAGLAL